MAELVPCPEDCTSLLPAWSFVDCGPEIEASEIVKIILGKPGQPFTETTPGAGPTLSAYNLRKAASDNTAIKEIICIGDLGLPEEVGAQEIQGVSGKINISLGNKYTLNFTIQQTSETNYESMRKMQCGGLYQMWFVTAGGKHIYGGLTGITCSIKMNPNFQRGANSLLVFEASATWTASHFPARTPNPLAA